MTTSADNTAPLIEALRAVARAAGVDTDDEQLRALAPQVVMLLRRFPAPKRSAALGETEPAFALRLGKS